MPRHAPHRARARYASASGPIATPFASSDPSIRFLRSGAVPPAHLRSSARRTLARRAPGLAATLEGPVILAVD
ncbi:MAG: hypothetical protein BGO98_46840 [Myxococcales bacterium 68-20]|nr:MAG: hypothetical protein BGO98_46840 [Myxococcales bacterium 68-20]